jgi:hypothetical protein
MTRLVKICSLTLAVCATLGLSSLSAVTAADTVDSALVAPRAGVISKSWLEPLRRTQAALRVDIEAPAPGSFKKQPPPKLGAPLQIGFARQLPARLESQSLSSSDAWVQGADGRWSLLIDIRSAEAKALRSSLIVERLPEGSQLTFFAADGTALDQSSARLAQGKTIWSPTAHGDAMTIQLQLPKGRGPEQAEIALGPISHFVVSPLDGKALLDFEKAAGACNLDAACYPEYEPLRQAVSRMIYTSGGSSFTCTGTLVNDLDADDNRLYYLTANHCLSDQSVADTLETLWYLEAAVCNGSGRSPQYTRLTGGADLLTTNIDTDSTLLLLREEPDVALNFAGWTTDFTPNSVTGIHHPSGDWKKISFGDAIGYSTRASSALLAASDPEANYLRVVWSEGTTEGGSSGSAIFDSQNHIVGTLYGGGASCSTPAASDIYGRFDRAYEVSNWQPYLFTDASQKPVTIAKDGAGSGIITSSPAGISCAGDCSRQVATFSKNATVTLTASALGDDRFVGWDAGSCDSNPTPTTCVVDTATAKLVKAQFAPDLTAVVNAINDSNSDVLIEWGAGGEPWEVSTVTAAEGSTSATSADISDNERSQLSATLTGPGELSFWWRVSSEQGYDFLEVSLDGEVLDSLSGVVPWRQANPIVIPSGSHTVAWTYLKDESISEGDDRGWIDSVLYTTDDSDGDGVPDDEDAFPSDPDESVDNDQDGLGANAEAALGTSDNDADSDDDGFTDLEEVEANTNPLSAGSVPGQTVLRLLLEEPVASATMSGVGNLRGWAVATDGIDRISIYIDDVYAFDAPYGGQRPDVAGSFPDVDDSLNSGFSLAFNYGNLTAGEHTVRAEAETPTGATVSSQATFTVLRFANSFIGDPNAVDVSGAQCDIDNRRLNLIDVLVEGQRTELGLQWRTATQGFELMRIE